MASDGTLRVSDPGLRLAAWGVHLLTATGVIWGLLALLAVFEGRYGDAYLWMGVAIVVDSVDGPLARRVKVKERVPEVDGALMDNIIDYLTWTFVPIVLIWHAGWLPAPAALFAGFALIGSLYAFVHTDAKQAEKGFFRGFPSYWNLLALFIDVGLRHMGPWVVAGVVTVLAALSVAPVRFVYPNRVKKHRGVLFWGAWTMVPTMIPLIVLYPSPPMWLVALNLVYPVVYTLLSFKLDWEDRQEEAQRAREAAVDSAA